MGGTEGAGGKGNDVSERTTTSIPKNNDTLQVLPHFYIMPSLPVS
jgi:hypothetical protein